LLFQQFGSVSHVGSVPGSAASGCADEGCQILDPARKRRLCFDSDNFTGRRLSVGASMPNRIPFVWLIYSSSPSQYRQFPGG
jgi:hypothetical protein